MDYLENINLNLNRSDIIYYGGICIFIYFFLSRIQFNNIILLLIIFMFVFGYIIFKKNKSKNKVIEDIKKDNNIIIENDDIDLEKLIDMINNIKELINKNDSLQNNEKERLEKDIINLIKEYINEVSIIYKQKSYGNFNILINIKKEILLNLHSLYFNSDIEQKKKLNDKIINKTITNMTEIFKEIEDYIKKEIKKDFYNEPNYLKNDINIYKEPSSFNDNTNLHTIIY